MNKTIHLLALLALAPLAVAPALGQAAEHIHPAPAPAAPATTAPGPAATPNPMGGMMEMMHRMMAMQTAPNGGVGAPLVIMIVPGMSMGMDTMGGGAQARPMMGNGMMPPRPQANAAAGEAPAGYQQELAAANAKMAAAMQHEPTNDPDRDFAMMMVPHHQGAIDMTRIELKYGNDPMLRELATAIIAAQESEIRMLETWLVGRMTH